MCVAEGTHANESAQPMSYSIRSTCRLCYGSLRLVLELPAMPLANAYPMRSNQSQEHYPLSISECIACGHVQCPVVVSPELLFQEYSYTTSTAASMRRHVSQFADEVASPGGVLVDIGSNDGLLLAESHSRGARSIGIDPARTLAAEATAKGRITLPAAVTPSLALQVRNLLGRSCTVTALNVFAHADDLKCIADSARELIHPGGVFVFEVAYLLDILEKNEIGSLYHEHLSHHHVAPLVEFFRRSGLELVRVERNASQGGTIRGYVRTAGSQRDSTVDSMVHVERALLPGLLGGWNERIRREQSDLMVAIEPYRGRGLAVFGAPARLTTYAYIMHLEHRDVACVFDDEPKKLGRFTPGLRWPIVPSSELMMRKPPAVLVAAWPYLSDIQRRFPDYQGAWLVPPRNK